MKLTPVPYATPKWPIHQDVAELGVYTLVHVDGEFLLVPFLVSYTGGTGVMLVVNGENPWHLALSDSPVTLTAYKMSLDIKQLRSDKDNTS